MGQASSETALGQCFYFGFRVVEIMETLRKILKHAFLTVVMPGLRTDLESIWYDRGVCVLTFPANKKCEILRQNLDKIETNLRQHGNFPCCLNFVSCFQNVSKISDSSSVSYSKPLLFKFSIYWVSCHHFHSL